MQHPVKCASDVLMEGAGVDFNPQAFFFASPLPLLCPLSAEQSAHLVFQQCELVQQPTMQVP